MSADPFVMTFAISRGVTQAGVAFAAMMMVGVALVLASVALTAVLFRQQLLRRLSARPVLVDAATRTIQVLAGIVLVTVAMNALMDS